MIRKLKSGEFRLYSRKLNPATGKRRDLGTFASRGRRETRTGRPVFQASCLSGAIYLRSPHDSLFQRSADAVDLVETDRQRWHDDQHVAQGRAKTPRCRAIWQTASPVSPPKAKAPSSSDPLTVRCRRSAALPRVTHVRNPSD